MKDRLQIIRDVKIELSRIKSNKFEEDIMENPCTDGYVAYGTKIKDGREVPNEIVLSREHNDANILSLGARFLSIEEAKEAVELWLETEFSGDERHVRRISKIEQFGL
jgi:hypothetical protein